MELPLRDVRGRARRCTRRARARSRRSPSAGTTGRGFSSTPRPTRVSSSRRSTLAGRRRPRRADRRRPADRRGDRPHGRAAAAARVRRRRCASSASAGVERALRDGYPVLAMLERYCGAEWQTLEPGEPRALDGSSLAVEPFEVGGDAPLYLGGSGIDLRGQRASSSATARAAPSSPTCPVSRDWDDDVLARLRGERPRARRRDVLARRRARAPRDLGPQRARHGARVAVGPGRHARGAGRPAGPRKVLVHINNTNPILLEDSPEREEVLRAGVEVAYDGLEVQL